MGLSGRVGMRVVRNIDGTGSIPTPGFIPGLILPALMADAGTCLGRLLVPLHNASELASGRSGLMGYLRGRRWRKLRLPRQNFFFSFQKGTPSSRS